MPIVPRYDRQVGLPSSTGAVGIDPSKVADPYRRAARVGASIVESGADLYSSFNKYQEHEEKARQTVEAMRLENSLKTDIDSFVGTLKDRTDYDKFDSDSEEFLRNTWDRYSKETTDPVVRMALEKSFLQSSFQAKQIVRTRKAQAITEVGKAQHAIIKDTALKEWAAADPEERPFIAKQYEMKVRELAGNNVFSLGDAEKYIQEFGKEADEYHFRGFMDADPLKAREAAKDPNQYQNTDPLTKAKWANMAEERYSVKQNRVERQEREAREDAAVEISTLIQAKETPKEEILTLIDKYQQRDPTTGIRKMTAATANEFRNRLLKDEDVKDDLPTYARLSAGIGRTSSPTTSLDVQQAFDSGKISLATAKNFLNSIRSEAEQDANEAKREAKAAAREAEREAEREAKEAKKEEKQRQREATTLRTDKIRTAKAVMMKTLSGDSERQGEALKEFDRGLNLVDDPYAIQGYADRIVANVQKGKITRWLAGVGKDVTISSLALQEAGVTRGNTVAGQVTPTAAAAPGQAKQEPKAMPTVPERNAWLKQAKAVPQNKGVSDEELLAFYDKKYGGKK